MSETADRPLLSPRRQHKSVLYVLRGLGSRQLLEARSVREADTYAHLVWDRWRSNPHNVGSDQLPRVLIEIELNGQEHVVKSYPEE